MTQKYVLWDLETFLRTTAETFPGDRPAAWRLGLKAGNYVDAVPRQNRQVGSSAVFVKSHRSPWRTALSLRQTRTKLSNSLMTRLLSPRGPDTYKLSLFFTELGNTWALARRSEILPPGTMVYHSDHVYSAIWLGVNITCLANFSTAEPPRKRIYHLNYRLR